MSRIKPAFYEMKVSRPPNYLTGISESLFMDLRFLSPSATLNPFLIKKYSLVECLQHKSIRKCQATP